jgi:hypothetical protein
MVPASRPVQEEETSTRAEQLVKKTSERQVQRNILRLKEADCRDETILGEYQQTGPRVEEPVGSRHGDWRGGKGEEPTGNQVSATGEVGSGSVTNGARVPPPSTPDRTPTFQNQSRDPTTSSRPRPGFWMPSANWRPLSLRRREGRPSYSRTTGRRQRKTGKFSKIVTLTSAG